MAINFPTGPAVNDTYTYNSVTYKWTGSFWTPLTYDFHGFFHVVRNAAQTTGISAGASSKVQFNTETADVNSYFDNATNYRYTPLVAGRYLIILGVGGTYTTAAETLQAVIQKNGAAVYTGTYNAAAAAMSTNFASACSGVISMNGSTDYIEGFAYFPPGTPTEIWAGTANTFMIGWRVGD